MRVRPAVSTAVSPCSSLLSGHPVERVLDTDVLSLKGKNRVSFAGVSV